MRSRSRDLCQRLLGSAASGGSAAKGVEVQIRGEWARIMDSLARTSGPMSAGFCRHQWWPLGRQRVPSFERPQRLDSN